MPDNFANPQGQALDSGLALAPEIRAQAMYWCGDSFMKVSVPAKEGAKPDQAAVAEAYRMFKKLTWDYPESKWAKFARGRLTESALAATAEKDQLAE